MITLIYLSAYLIAHAKSWGLVQTVDNKHAQTGIKLISERYLILNRINELKSCTELDSAIGIAVLYRTVSFKMQLQLDNGIWKHFWQIMDVVWRFYYMKCVHSKIYSIQVCSVINYNCRFKPDEQTSCNDHGQVDPTYLLSNSRTWYYQKVGKPVIYQPIMSMILQSVNW